jgi:hypothetical protein
MTTDIDKLKESMHALVTPPFTGTHEEMIGAVGYWVTMISHLRSLFNIVSSHENRSAIVDQLEKEVGIMKAELDNLSAELVTDKATGQTSMVQPVASLAPEPASQTVPAMVEPTVDLSVRESMLDRIKANAGVPQNSIKVHPLSKLSK